MSDTKKAEKIVLNGRERFGIVEILGIRGAVDKLSFMALKAKDGARVIDVRWQKGEKDFAVRLVQKLGETGYGQVPAAADRSEMKKRLADPASAASFDLVQFVLERRFHGIPVSFEAWEEWEVRIRADLAPKAPAVEAAPLAAE